MQLVSDYLTDSMTKSLASAMNLNIGDVNTVSMKGGEKRKADWEIELEIEKETIAYCRIGERSSHTWFVLQELLGKKNVKNYDGSLTEYGSLVGVPVALLSTSPEREDTILVRDPFAG